MLDFNREYRIALELASTLRYKEARGKLKSILLEQPDNVDTLILLGKVEYYLRLFPSSRRRFETALTYYPGNFEAYYGLQYFNERKKRFWIIGAWTASICLLLLMGFFLNISVGNRFNQFGEKINSHIEYYNTTESKLSDDILTLSNKLEHHGADIKEIKGSTEVLIEELGEKIENLELKQVLQYTELKDNQLESLKIITANIKELKEIAIEERNENAAAVSD